MHDRKEVHAAHLAAGANRQSAAADWGDDGNLCFGAGVNVAVWRPTSVPERGILSLLRGHQDTVKAVHFLSRRPGSADGGQHLVSGGDDCALKLWAVGGADGSAACVQTVEAAHAAAINCLAAPRASRPRLQLLASGAADASIKIWGLRGGSDGDDGTPAQLVLLQTIQTAPRYFPLCLALEPLEDGEADSPTWMLAAGGTSNRIQVFVGSSSAEASIDFRLQATLTGHEGWLRSLDLGWERSAVDGSRSGDVLLASASQDKYIRLWRIRRGDDMPTTAAAAPAADPLSSLLLPSSTASPAGKAHRMQAAATAGGAVYSVTFEALLLGHEDWIYSARWDRVKTQDQNGHGLRLLSASADNSLAVWEADTASGLWLTTARLGELSKEKGATTATGSVGGFWTALWSPSGRSVATLCRTGSWRRWQYDAVQDRWQQAVGISGHIAAVTGIAWSRDGAYLLSTGSDQTTRLHTAWRRVVEGADTKEEGLSWHEMARPQIHGYDLNCIDALGTSQFVSGADEKLMRVFHEPKTVARLLAQLTKTAADDATTKTASTASIDALPDAANMPVLGLSNKAIDATDADVVTEETDSNSHPPFEDILSRNTLWPETEKLYGHGYEISCLAVSHDGCFVASACRASSLNHAVLRLFETRHWTEVKPPLAVHTLTATRLRFSADDRFLLSVGRDRQWAVFERQAGEPGEADSTLPVSYALREANAKAHARMLLDCAWAPAGQKKRVFATAGRDKNAKIWAAAEDGSQKESFALAATIPQEHPVTALDFLWRPSAEAAGLVLAVGTEAGRLSVFWLHPESLAVSAALALDADLCLPRAVLQLAWRPARDDSAEEANAAQLAIAGDDSSLRVYQIQL
ncbi:RNA polymerase 2 elongator [Grosmannia clavigera kw1407]|uniref:Elongator complex protein 2 n=1 Tax=Grosmannia clavigera (strain kw1407 / UAMH 11150) TaxID=655863 RepID=F0XRF1_GROCL|nr:RNA polymerase 2 elongator [Grosmannia clavigera kw1407]EFW99965.1 RNA polymerase 2 elongator [Grosmannia clavigera kw1407]